VVFLLITAFEGQTSCVCHSTSVARSRFGEVLNLIIENLRIVVRPATREQIRRALTAWVGPTRVESGCMNCRILQEDNEPHSFYYTAQWKTPEDLMRHLRSEHYKRLLVLMDLGEEPPIVEFHTVTETRGLDLIQQARNAF
jgi:quinol monooxygenase YgiN